MAIFTRNAPIVTETPTIAVEDLPPGRHRFQLVVEDESGNQSQPASATVAVLSPAPAITSFSPSYGNWGDQVVINGANFDLEAQKNIVAFNGVGAPVTGSTRTTLTVSVPRPATTGRIVVKTGIGEAISPSPFVIPTTFTMKVGPQPADLAYDPVKGEVWVVNSGPVEGRRGTVSVVDLGKRAVVATILVGVSPVEIALSPNSERRLAVVSNYGDATASVINMDTRRVVKVLKMGVNPLGVDISPDGHWGYVVSSGGGTAPVGAVTVIDLSLPNAGGIIQVGQAPTRVVFGRDGKEAFVNNTGDGTVSVIDVSAHKVSKVVKVGGDNTSSPQEVALSQETYPVWTANMGVRGASLVAAGHSVTNIPVNISPASVAVSPKGDRGFLVGPRDKSMVAVVLRHGLPLMRKVEMLDTGGIVKAVAMTSDASGAVVAHPNSNAVSFFETDSLMLRCFVRVPALPIRCLVTDGQKFACVICQKGDAMAAIEVRSVLP